VARALAQRGLETVVLERASAIGTGSSSRNSEVVHAGLYYPDHSLKARLCVRGREQLYAYCAARGVPHRRCGKLLVATEPQQRALLEQLHAQAQRNGVDDLQWLDARQAQALEPQLRAVAAVWSPSTGIVDSHALMLALWADLQAHGGSVVCRAPVEAARPGSTRHELSVGGAEPSVLAARWVVNAAGLWAPGVAARVAAWAAQPLPQPCCVKGSYFSYSGAAPFARLIYPMPDAAGLGVHLTLDLGGRARFGPDVEWLDAHDPDAIDYRVDARRAESFEAAVRRYWPGLPAGSLAPDYSGVRPKVRWGGRVATDFIVHGPAQHGVAGWVNLFGIESPGLTSSLALADEVLSRLLGPDPPRSGAPTPSAR
jgi:L-2-hydroxyglutarate oxidase LhgO